jgi:hypothetical protein
MCYTWDNFVHLVFIMSLDCVKRLNTVTDPYHVGLCKYDPWWLHNSNTVKWHEKHVIWPLSLSNSWLYMKGFLGLLSLLRCCYLFFLYAQRKIQFGWKAWPVKISAPHWSHKSKFVVMKHKHRIPVRSSSIGAHKDSKPSSSGISWILMERPDRDHANSYIITDSDSH